MSNNGTIVTPPKPVKRTPLPDNSGRAIHHLIGSDPEFFFKDSNGLVVGAEKILPEQGLKTGTGAAGKVIIDGVQGEFNLPAHGCRESFGNEFIAAFRDLAALLAKLPEKHTICIDQIVDVTPEEIASLKPTNKVFGCDPSKNAYNIPSKLEGIDAEKHPTRSAGGHIHLGFVHPATNTVKDVFNLIPGGADTLTKIMDIVVGNTCVLIDRSSGNRERRKLYGIAGEYRLPKHGYEYRVLSNFWLRSYPLASLVTGLVRAAFCIATSTHNKVYIPAFFEAVDLDAVQKAINTNNYHLALSNFKKIEQYLIDIFERQGAYVPLSSRQNIDNFLYFAESCKEEGMDAWFPSNPVFNWCQIRSGGSWGAHSFLAYEVQKRKDRIPVIAPRSKGAKVKQPLKNVKTAVVKVKKETLLKKASRAIKKKATVRHAKQRK